MLLDVVRVADLFVYFLLRDEIIMWKGQEEIC